MHASTARRIACALTVLYAAAAAVLGGSLAHAGDGAAHSPLDRTVVIPRADLDDNTIVDTKAPLVANKGALTGKGMQGTRYPYATNSFSSAAYRQSASAELRRMHEAAFRADTGSVTNASTNAVTNAVAKAAKAAAKPEANAKAGKAK